MTFVPDHAARALLVRVEGGGEELTWDLALERTNGFAERLTKAQVTQVLALLAASWVKRGETP